MSMVWGALALPSVRPFIEMERGVTALPTGALGESRVSSFVFDWLVRYSAPTTTTAATRSAMTV